MTNRTILTPETSQLIRELQPAIQAINLLFNAYHIASDHMGEKDIDEHDERVRDITYDTHESLFHSLREIAAEYNLEIRFNRTSGQFVLLDQP